MAERFVGVVAYALMINEEIGDMPSLRLLTPHGGAADPNAAWSRLMPPRAKANGRKENESQQDRNATV